MAASSRVTAQRRMTTFDKWLGEVGVVIWVLLRSGAAEAANLVPSTSGTLEPFGPSLAKPCMQMPCDAAFSMTSSSKTSVLSWPPVQDWMTNSACALEIFLIGA